MSETLREGVERLVDEWCPAMGDTLHDAIADIRALLAATAPTPDEVGQVEGRGSYCIDTCTWPHEHRFERDGISWPAHQGSR